LVSLFLEQGKAMKLRFIKPGSRSRLVVRGPFTDDMLDVGVKLEEMGFKPATCLQFLGHLLFWRKPKK
jgi:hypothetical protein